MTRRVLFGRILVVIGLFAVGCSPVGAVSGGDGEKGASSGQQLVFRAVGVASDAVAPEVLAGQSDATDRDDKDRGGEPDSTADAVDVGDTGIEALVDPDAELGTPDQDPQQADTAATEQPSGTIVAHAITENITAYVSPSDTAEQIEVFSNPTEYGGPLVFQALGPASGGWLEVLLPIRPNGSTGWIPADQVDLTINPYRIEIDASAYELTVYREEEVALSTTVAIGNGSTPTPLGRFYLVELLRPRNQAGPYGSYAYGLSGHSETLDSFNGGDGGIGIHGTNRPDLLGQDVSHGCIRVANPTIEEMAGFLPLGTPVHIFRSSDDTA